MKKYHVILVHLCSHAPLKYESLILNPYCF
jgi:hypothetical protein